MLLKNDVMAPNWRGIRFAVFGTWEVGGRTEGVAARESKDVGLQHTNWTTRNTLTVMTVDHVSL